MPHFVTLDIVDAGVHKGQRTFAQVEIEVGSFGQIEIDDDDFGSDDFKIFVLPEGVFLSQRWGDDGLAVNGEPIKKQRQLAAGDVITQGGTSKITVIAMGEASEMPDEGTRYIAVEILDKCPHCGAGQPMNGPLDEVVCLSCNKSCHPKPAYWESVLEDLIADYQTGGGSFSLNFQINVRWKAGRPACVKCKAELPADEVPSGATDDIRCPSCGAANTTYPAPQWMKSVLPSFGQVFCADRISTGGGAIDTDGARPVVLSCPACAGSLKVTGISDRTVTCQYCNSDVYLPDDLWTRLHPVKTATTWYFRLEGLSKKQLEENSNRQEKIEEVRQTLQEERAAVVSERRGKAVGIFLPVGIGVAVALVVLVGTIYEAVTGDSTPVTGPGQVAEVTPNWSADQLQPSRINVNNQWFSLYSPAAVPANDGVGIQWQNPSNGQGQSYLYVRVAPARTPATLPAAVTAASAGQAQPVTVTRNGQIPGGFSVTLSSPSANRLEVVVYKTRAGTPAGYPGLECRAVLQTNTGVPLTALDSADAYLNQICGSLTVE